MWQAFVQWFSSIINFMYGITVNMGIPSYGLAIILMTILIKIVLFPLTQKQMKSMRAMQEIQPKIKQIQERYKNDSKTMQTKVMEMYKQHSVSPFGGCLPLVIQMPIFIAFYRSLYDFDFKVVAHAKFLWIPNIGHADPYYILAVIAGITTYLQQRVSMVDTNDPTQKTMLYITPIFMAWIATTMPAGLPIYWIVFNILGIAQQLYVNRQNKLVKMDTGTGITVETKSNSGTVEITDDKASTLEKVAERDKGGKKEDGSPSCGKKRKER